MRTIKILILFIATLGALHAFAKNPKVTKGKTYSDKKFYFAAWGGVGGGSQENQLARMKVLATAGITDLLPGVGADRLKEMIKIGNQCGVRIHAWHWMMNVGGSKECREHPDWYSVNRLGQNCRDFHPTLAIIIFLVHSPQGPASTSKTG